MTDPKPTHRRYDRWGLAKRMGVLLFVAALVAFAYIQFGEQLTLEHLAHQESRLRIAQREHPVLVYGAAFAIYASVTGLSVPGAATPLTLAYGWYFGLLRAVVLVSFASTTGATVAFLLSRYLFRDAIRHRFGERLVAFDRALAREGPFFLFTLRLIPAVPFFVINAVMGLTPTRATTYWWVSQVGMLPGTIVYVYAGSSVPNLRTLADEGIRATFTATQLTQILFAFALLGIFPLLVRYTMRLVRPVAVESREVGEKSSPNPEVVDGSSREDRLEGRDD